ncbi:MAG: hypothetical protein Q7J15_12850 [Candidatus Desulfaltia sp.]|nr:hypothetical protein [Candidatus Desulfaltia sp.]
MDKSLGDQLAALVIKGIQDAYCQGKIITTNDCINDMMRDGLFEADVEKVIMGAAAIEKAMLAMSPLASSPRNTHYVITGESTKCVKVYCKICSNYHPATDEFIGWRLTSFCIDKPNR